MKKFALLLVLASLGAANLRADDQIAAVQQELKDQGFYYGQVDGQGGAETTAAIRRYQIRNGLQVDGTLNQQTLDSLKIAGNAAAPSKLPPQPAPLDGQQAQAPAAPAPPQDVTQSDRQFLKQSGSPATPPPPSAPAAPVDNQPAAPAPEVQEQQAPQPPPQPQAPQAPPLAAQYAVLFARTPYQNAPFEVQQGTVRNAQIQLARQTYYNGNIDGIPGPGTQHAIAAFQGNAGLEQTGLLDLPTLSALRLLPNQAPVPRRVIVQPFYPPPPPEYVPPRRVYRGIWVN